MGTGLSKRDLVVLVAALAYLAGVFILLDASAPGLAFPVLILAAVVVLLAVLLSSHRKLTNRIEAIQRAESSQRRYEFHHLEALMSLLHTLQPVAPLSATRGWAAAPDFLKLVAETVLREKPSVVVEASSGTSTLIVAYCLKRLGAGKVISLEHEEKYAELTREAIALHQLEAYAEVIHAPLVETTLNGGTWKWYDVSRLTVPGPIDLVIVDGPPGTIQQEARYPALPVLHDRLAKRATMLLDDARRDDEQRLVKRWVTEFPGARAEFIELEKGAYVVTVDQ